MALQKIFVVLTVCWCASQAFPANVIDIITEPKPGQEYVFVQSSASGARPISRKDKVEKERPFETAHKLPPSLTFALNQHELEEKQDEGVLTKKPHKREAGPGEGPAPAPAGAIKLDVQQLLAKYKTELKTSTTEKPKTSSTTTTKSSKRRRPSRNRTKKEVKPEDASLIATSPSPVLTTGSAVPKKVDDDIPLLASGSEKQRSRIQIKKGPNGQEYEYEYVYYYYDDDDEGAPKDAKDKVTNSHDGPAKNQITTRGGDKKSTEANEVLPKTTGKTRGRQLGEEETVNEERLPANTRFPPRSRNLNTTPLPEEETKGTTSRGRGRGRPTTEAAAPSSAAPSEDNVSDETQGSRGRTRANVRRPSLEFVDSATFNTHSNAEPPAGGPSFPTDLPAGPEPKVEEPKPAPVAETVDEGAATITPSEEPTTAMSPMDKVALDLYAVVQGTQKLAGEDEISTDAATDETELTTLEALTEIETTTPTTTTTTTTTTTPAPTTTTTTTTEAAIGRGRYRGRGGIGRKTTKSHDSNHASTESAPSETKPKSKFGRPSFGNRRSHQKTTPEPNVEQDATKEEAKPVSHARPTLSRSRFGASRPRGRTTPAPTEEGEKEESKSTSAPATHHRPSLPRARPTFNLRSRGRTTAAPTEGETSSSASEESGSSAETASSTTVRTRRISAGSGVRPLRPGPRINLANRRGGTTTTTEAAVEDHVTGDEEVSHSPSEETAEKDQETSPAPAADNSPLGRLRNKHRVNVQARPKAAASAPVQVRRVNPLLGRRRPGQTTEAAPSEPPQEAAATEPSAEEGADTEAPVPSSSSTTEEPRGLNKLLAGRRRLAVRQPGTTTH